MVYHTCLIDETMADLYIHYFEVHDVKHIMTYNTETEQVHLEIWGTVEELGLFKRWMLKTTYHQEAQHG